jgi:hypothetical protein
MPAYGPDSRDARRLVAELAAILSFGAGVIHISAAGDHAELPVMFAAFLLVAALQIALGVILLRRPPSRLIIVAAVAMALSSIGLWVLSRTVGLSFIAGEDVEPVGFKDGITKLLEIASIPALLLLLSSDLEHVSVPPRLGRHAVTMLGAVCLALMPPALLLGEAENHSPSEAMEMALHDAHEGTAHAGSPSSDHPHGESAVRHAHQTHESGTHHTTTTAAGGHDHTVLASAPLGVTHEHGAAGTPGDHADQHGEDRHQGGKHRNHHGGKHHGGDHGHGDHEPPEAEPAVSISYEPEPSVCVGGTLCVP